MLHCMTARKNVLKCFWYFVSFWQLQMVDENKKKANQKNTAHKKKMFDNDSTDLQQINWLRLSMYV